MEHELKSKHHEKKLLRNEIKSLSIQLKMSLSLMVYSVLLNGIHIAIKSRVKVIKLRHNKKICSLNKRDGIVQEQTSKNCNALFLVIWTNRRRDLSFITWFRSTYSINIDQRIPTLSIFIKIFWVIHLIYHRIT